MRWIGSEARALSNRCKVCDYEGALLAIVEAKHITQSLETLRFYRCPQCDSVTLPGAILAFDHIQENARDVFLRQYVESTAGIWEMFWPIACVQGAANKSLLDVGCGFGFTADAWKHGFHAPAAGCDPAPYAAEGRKVLGDHIFHGLLDDIPELANQRFDVVYASEVIEHVPDPGALVDLLIRRLKPKGVLVLTTPAADYLLPTSDPSTAYAALAPGFHEFLFSTRALERLLLARGFAHVSVERHNERLIAWASDTPIEKSAPESALGVYLNYLSERVHRGFDEDANGQSVKSGLLYRLFRDCLLRGLVPDRIDTFAAQVQQSLLLDTGPKLPTPDDIHAMLIPLSPGPSAMAAHARCFLPQAAFLLGLRAEQTNTDSDVARSWYLLAIAATEKLCADSAIHGLEAVAFSWSAMRALVGLDVRQRAYERVLPRAVRMLRALCTPDSRTGTSAPPPQLVRQCIDQWREHMAAQDSPEIIELTGARLAAAASLDDDQRSSAADLQTMLDLEGRLFCAAAEIRRGNYAGARHALDEAKVSRESLRSTLPAWHASVGSSVASLHARAQAPSFATTFASAPAIAVKFGSGWGKN